MIDKREDFLSDHFALEYVKGQPTRRAKLAGNRRPSGDRFVRTEMRADEILLRHREPDDFSVFHNLKCNLNAYEKDLLEKFILHMGPEAVFKHTQIHRKKDEDQDHSTFSRALGISFERLAAISLTEIISDVNNGKENSEKLFLLDPGSASRVFGHIYDKICVVPDGAIIQINPDTSITLKHLVEYKLNPRVRQNELEAQIAKMLSFLEVYRNQTIKTPWINFDTQKRIGSNRIHIDGSAGVFLVSPNDKQEIGISNNKVFQIQTPFDTRFVIKVANASLHSGINSNG